MPAELFWRFYSRALVARWRGGTERIGVRWVGSGQVGWVGSVGILQDDPIRIRITVSDLNSQTVSGMSMDLPLKRICYFFNQCNFRSLSCVYNRRNLLQPSTLLLN